MSYQYLLAGVDLHGARGIKPPPIWIPPKTPLHFLNKKIKKKMKKEEDNGDEPTRNLTAGFVTVC